MLSRSELEKLAELRLEESRALYDKGLFDGALYLAGYVIEFSLKAMVCKTLNLKEYPSNSSNKRVRDIFKKHDHDVLLVLSGLFQELEDNRLKSINLDKNWSIVSKWSTEFRYNQIGTSKSNSVLEYLEALTDKNYGIYTWIKKHL